MGRCETPDRRDVCEPFGNDTLGHGPVGTSPGCWTGITEGAAFGELDLYGCDVGCWHCDDIPVSMLLNSGAYIDGTRWLKPINDPNLGVDAEGTYRPLPTDGTVLAWRPVVYMVAPCYNGLGEECHDRDICECGGGADPYKCIAVAQPDERCPRGNTCVPGEVLGQPTSVIIPELLRPDTFWYTGYQWPTRPQRGNMLCRTFFQSGPLPVALGPRRFWQTDQLRLDRDCNANALIYCAGRAVEQGTCLCCYACEGCSININDWLGIPPTNLTLGRHNIWYHEDTAVRNQFAEIGVPEMVVSLREPETPGPFRSLVRARNAVLAEIASRAASGTPYPLPGGGVALDRMDYWHLIGHDADSRNNDDIDYWQRGWLPPIEPGRFDLEVVVPDFPILARVDGEAYAASLTMYFAKVHASIVPWVIRSQTWLGRPCTVGVSAPCPMDIEVHVRLVIEAFCSVRIHGLELRSDMADFPRGRRITFYDVSDPVADGPVPFTPPRSVRWEGYLGRTSDPPADRQPIGTSGWSNWFGTPTEVFCNRLMDIICRESDGSGRLIPAWPGRGTDVYEGHVRLAQVIFP